MTTPVPTKWTKYEVKEALTADRQFEQVGFNALLADAEQ
jgi:hypothetical protein